LYLDDHTIFSLMSYSRSFFSGQGIRNIVLHHLDSFG
jgi:hypothetical protein